MSTILPKAYKLAEQAKALDENKKLISRTLYKMHESVIANIENGHCKWNANFTSVTVTISIDIPPIMTNEYDGNTYVNTDVFNQLMAELKKDGFENVNSSHNYDTLVSTSLDVPTSMTLCLVLDDGNL